MLQAIQNLGLALVALLAGYIVDTCGYMWLEVFFVGCLFLAMISTGLMWLVDYRGSGYLNMSAKQRTQYHSPDDEEPTDEIFN